MTKKHFKAIADAICELSHTVPQEHLCKVAIELAKIFKTINKNFNAERFIKACNFHILPMDLMDDFTNTYNGER